MSIKVLIRNALALACNMLLVFVAYTACRLLFVWSNGSLYQGMPWAHLWELLRAGLVFDASAICYTNLIIVTMFLLPLHWKERKGFYLIAKWIYVVINSVCIAANLSDIVYFPFTGKRTTASVVQEFGNEGAGQLAKIFAEHAVANWWLVVAFVVIVAMLWVGFRNPYREKRSRHVRFVTYRPKSGSHVGYYVGQTVALCAIGYLCVGMMRGGFTTATRPITISNANQYVDTPSEAGVVLNTPFSIIRTMGKRPFTVPQYMSDDEARGLYWPEHSHSSGSIDSIKNIENVENVENVEDSIASIASIASKVSSGSRKLNVVVLILESFSKQHIGFYNRQHNENGAEGDKNTFTPFLDSLLTHGALTFRYSYANGRKSIEGMPSVLSSIPNFVEPFFLTPASMNRLSGLARELSEHAGYESAFFHGAENGSMGFEAFAKATGFQRYYGRTEYCADARYGGDDDFDGTWAIWDEEFLQFYCDRMSEMHEPFVTSVFTASSHSPFKVPARYEDHFPTGSKPLQRCVAYSDNALRRFFDKARRQPWYDNTLFVITADHTSSHFDPHYTTTLGQASVPIIFYSPCLPHLRGYDDSTVVEQTDIMPTVMSLIGYDHPYVAFGQDILHTPRSDKFAMHWLPETSSYEFVHGRYALQFDGATVTAIYDYKKDPLQKRNLVSATPADTIKSSVRLMKAVIQQYMKRMNEDKLTVDNK